MQEQQPFDAVLLAGYDDPAPAERLLSILTSRQPARTILVAMRDRALTRLLAEKFGVISAPWPPDALTLNALILGGGVILDLSEARREMRWRTQIPAIIEHDGANKEGLVLNVSNHGVMFLGEAGLAADDPLSLGLRYAGTSYRLSGTVRHVSDRLELTGLRPDELTWTPNQLSIIGVRFDGPSVADARRLCATITEERRVSEVRAICVPDIPPALEKAWQRYRISSSSLPHVPDLLVDMPQMFVVDVNACDVSSLKLLARHASRALIIGLLDGDVPRDRYEAAATGCHALFRIPQDLAKVEEVHRILFAGTERELPLIAERFTARLVHDTGENILAAGLQLGLNFCTVAATTPLPPGYRLRGTLVSSSAIRSYPFQADVRFCQPIDSRYRIGLRLHVEPFAISSYQQYFRQRLMERSVARWIQRLIAFQEAGTCLDAGNS